DSLGSDDMHQRAALNAGEDGRVDDFFVFGLHHDDAATRATQRFVRGGSDEVGVRNRVGVLAAGDEACIVGDIHHEQGAVFASDTTHALKVDTQGVSGSSADNQLGFVFASQALKRVVIELFFFVQAIGNKVVQLPGGVNRRTMCQVAPFGQ